MHFFSLPQQTCSSKTTACPLSLTPFSSLIAPNIILPDYVRYTATGWRFILYRVSGNSHYTNAHAFLFDPGALPQQHASVQLQPARLHASLKRAGPCLEEALCQSRVVAIKPGRPSVNVRCLRLGGSPATNAG